MIYGLTCTIIFMSCAFKSVYGAMNSTQTTRVSLSTTLAPPRTAFYDIDLFTLAQAINIPTCESNCTEMLLLKLYGILEMKDIFGKWKDLCNDYNQSTVCMERPNKCSHGEIYRVITSGISNLCIRKEKFFDKNKDCIKPNLDLAAQECDRSCNMIKSVADLSHKDPIREASTKNGNIMTVLTELGSVCSAINCFLPCFRKKMNQKCAHSGGMIVDGVLKPFYILVKFLDSASPVVKNVVKTKVPKSCSFLMKKESLDSIRQHEMS